MRRDQARADIAKLFPRGFSDRAVDFTGADVQKDGILFSCPRTAESMLDEQLPSMVMSPRLLDPMKPLHAQFDRRVLPDGEWERVQYMIPAICTFIAQHTAYIPPDFEAIPWSELGRQWPHPESYLDKLRLFRSRENLGDRQVIVTVCLADNWPTPEGDPCTT